MLWSGVAALERLWSLLKKAKKGSQGLCHRACPTPEGAASFQCILPSEDTVSLLPSIYLAPPNPGASETATDKSRVREKRARKPL